MCVCVCGRVYVYINIYSYHDMSVYIYIYIHSFHDRDNSEQELLKFKQLLVSARIDSTCSLFSVEGHWVTTLTGVRIIFLQSSCTIVTILERSVNQDVLIISHENMECYYI